MHFQFIKPSPFLSRYIKHYWIMETDGSEGDICERVIPTENTELLFHYKKPFIVNPGVPGCSVQPRSGISGLGSTFSDVSTNGEAGVIAVSFFPMGACHFFRFPFHELKNQGTDLRNIYSKEISGLDE